MINPTLIPEPRQSAVVPPRVSVVVPNYNHASYLRQRIDSILDQTWQDFELIILDDCSPDGSRDVIREYAADPRVRVAFNDSNSGCVFRQWNKGIGMASGELVWIAESDDYSDPRFLETMVNRLDANPNVGIAFCNSYRVCDGEISLPHERWFREFADQYHSDFVANGASYVAAQMLFTNTIPNASSAVFRKSIAGEAGLADDSFLLSGDWLFWIRLLSFSDLAYVCAPLNYYRYHQATARHKYSSNGVMIEEALRIATIVLEAFPVQPPERTEIRERLISWYIETRIHEAGQIPPERRHRIDRLATELDPSSRCKLWMRRSGIGWLWLGFRRRFFDFERRLNRV